ncbi:DUF4886 domain-containing protein [Parapedobacter tibetensis]|uniref:DUF4886 domain-containing protein n=1 Tax=Parapedobacter tibetensis TaxID=2972951 RepID=UPI00214D779E|nr:DUF4886 domain-containing protein [Parapedobacter tibetensis]
MLNYTRFFLVISLFLSVAWNGHVQGKPDTLRILAIGNSFSQDAVEQYLHELAEATGKPMIIGNMYIGGAPLSLHLENVQGNKAVYSYRKIDVDGTKTTQKEISILTALRDEPWDYVSLQQVSSLSGRMESFLEPLPIVHRYIDSVMAGNAKFIWHQTWAYQANSTHKRFINYNKDQQTMYQAIASASSKVSDVVQIDLLVPCGTAIQNARTSFLGDNLTRDGFHLDLQIGRFIAACTWYESLFGRVAPVDQYRPEQVTEAQAEVARQAAHAAVGAPFSVTEIAVEEAEAVPN